MVLLSAALSPPIIQLKSLSLSTPFLHRFSVNSTTPLPIQSTSSSSSSFPVIKAMRTLTGRVVCNTNDKTVAVEVVRLAPHPKYKRRVRHKKKYQAHDPLNQFQVGDIVQLQKGRPISKTKTFWALPAQNRNGPKTTTKVDGDGEELGIPLESEKS